MADEFKPVYLNNEQSQYANDFMRNGHPGKWNASITCNTGTTIFTGSNYGVGALVVVSGSTGTITLSEDNSQIPLQTFTGLVELSPFSIDVSSGTVYALKRNFIIR
ncbi:hypothetical protein [Microcystis phage Mel-JY01]